MTEKSYKGFIVWLISFFLLEFLVPFLPIDNIALITRISLTFMLVHLTLLMYMIYKTENIYWFNGITFEEALQAGSQRRRAYAYKHLIHFTIFTFLFFASSILFHIFNINYWVDIIIGCLGIIITAFSTIKIKL